MSRRLIIRGDAEAELEAAADWYEARREGLGVELIHAFRDKLRDLREHPTRFPAVHRHGRRALVDRFPYAIYYTLDDTELIEVVAVLHCKQNPRAWKKRFR